MIIKLSLAALLATVFFAGAHAGDSPPDTNNTETFLKTFLTEQPRFQASGIFTSRKAGKPPVTCGARVRFDKDVGAVFSYNTSGEEDLEPYDFYYWKRTLALFVYDRERNTIVKSELLGAPLRPLFNFVWDVVEEGEKGRGIKSLIFSGLMRMTVEENAGSISVVFTKNLVPLPIRELSFTFDTGYRLRAFKLTESDGSTHAFQVLQHSKLIEKLRRPKIQKAKRPVE